MYKEALAIYVCLSFITVLWKISSLCSQNHLTLPALVREENGLPEMAAGRLHRLATHLSWFNYNTGVILIPIR